MALEIGRYEEGSWRSVGELKEHPTAAAARTWAERTGAAPGEYVLRGPKGRDLYMFRVEADGVVGGISVLDID